MFILPLSYTLTLYYSGLKMAYFFFSSRRRHTRSLRDWSSDVCSSDLADLTLAENGTVRGDGTLVLGMPNYGVRAFTLRAHDLNLQRWVATKGAPAPPSRLAFTLAGSVEGDSATP